MRNWGRPELEIQGNDGLNCLNENSGLVLSGIPTKFTSVETATVILEGDCQTVRLPKSVHLPTNIFVRQEGESVVLEPAKPKTWPEGFFDPIHVTDPAFERPEQGQLPPVKNL